MKPNSSLRPTTIAVLTAVVVFAIPTAVRAACVSPPSGIVSWWPGDLEARDIVGHNHGQIVGTVGYAPGVVGQAFDFNGNGLVLVQDDPTLDLPTELSIEFWFKNLDPDMTQGIIARRDEETNCPTGCLGRIPASNYAINLWSNGNIGTMARYCPVGPVGNCGNWYTAEGTPFTFHHYVATLKQVDSEHVLGEWYIDGQAKSITNPWDPYGAVQPGILANAVNNVNLTIGASNEDSGLYEPAFGLIDELTLYNRALSAAEAAALYAAGADGKCKSPNEPVVMISDIVGQLVATGSLTQGHGQAILDRLHAAMDKALEQGKLNAACNMVEALIKGVEGPMQSGQIPQADGAALINQFELIMQDMNCP